MATFCTQCGKELKEGVAFCTECGAKVSTGTAAAESAPPIIEEAPQPIPTPTVQTTPVQQTYQAAPTPVYAAPVQTVTPQAAAKPDPVSTGYFFGRILLYSIPVVGILLCLFTAFTAKDKNKRNFAKAMLIWAIIGLIISILLFLLFRWIGNVVSDYIATLMNGSLGDLSILSKLGFLGDLGVLGDLGSLAELGSLGDLSALGDLGALGDLSSEDLGALQELLEQLGESGATLPAQ